MNQNTQTCLTTQLSDGSAWAKCGSAWAKFEKSVGTENSDLVCEFEQSSYCWLRDLTCAVTGPLNKLNFKL